MSWLKRVTVAPGKDAADLAAESGPDEFGTAEALHRIRRADVQCRQRRVARGAQVDVVDVQLTARARDVGPSVERRPDGRRDVHRRGIETGPIHGRDLRLPQRVIGTADQQSLQDELRRAAHLQRFGQDLTPLRGLGLGLDDVDRRQGPQLDASLVVRDQILRQLDELLLHGDRLGGDDEIPVGAAHGRLGVGDHPPQVDVRELPGEPCHLKTLADRIDLEVPQQRVPPLP